MSRTDKKWEKYLKEKLTFPFEDDLYGIIVSVRKGRKKHSIALVDLEPINLDNEGKIAVKEYQEWLCNR